jgi:two-component system response regulator AtoC
MSPKILSILLADDEPIVRKTIGDYLIESGHQVKKVNDGTSALKYIEDQDYDLALLDIRMPGIDGLTLLKRVREIRPELSVVLITAHGNMETAIQALRYGATDFLNKPVKLLELEAVLEKSIQVRKLRQERRHLRETIQGIQLSDDLRSANRNLLGNSEVTRKVREQIQQIVEAGLETILLTGETGTGKEVVAREIHSLANSDKSIPFIAVSCPALPDSLVDSELFGHVKGAFTGATADRPGYFELANGGTLFLDEVADLSPTAQATLLRVLETRTLRRVGGSKEIQVKVRVIAASNVDLVKYIEQGKFRRDLYYRLNVYSIHLLPLRERKDDIMPLAEYFLSVFCKTRSFPISGFSSQAEKMMLNYDFPGNARELKNVVERAAVLCKTSQVLPEHLNLPDHHTDLIPTNQIDSSTDQEHAIILKALEHAKWNRRMAASNLGMPYSTLRFKMQKFGIK